jgi:hypothetical protein
MPISGTPAPDQTLRRSQHHSLEAHLTDTIAQHSAERELRSFCVLGLASRYTILDKGPHTPRPEFSQRGLRGIRAPLNSPDLSPSYPSELLPHLHRGATLATELRGRNSRYGWGRNSRYGCPGPEKLLTDLDSARTTTLAAADGLDYFLAIISREPRNTQPSKQ